MRTGQLLGVVVAGKEELLQEIRAWVDTSQSDAGDVAR